MVISIDSGVTPKASDNCLFASGIVSTASTVPKGETIADPDRSGEGVSSKGYAHTLSLRLTADQVMHDRFGGASPAEIARVRDIFYFAINAGDHNVAVDDAALTSRVDAEDGGGLWVQGWLWIPGADEDEDTLD